LLPEPLFSNSPALQEVYGVFDDDCVYASIDPFSSPEIFLDTHFSKDSVFYPTVASAGEDIRQQLAIKTRVRIAQLWV
jgi:hypothetical protein